MINLLPDDDQRQIIDRVAGFISRELPIARFRRGTRADNSIHEWAKMAELGCFGLALSDSQGGAGFSLAEEVLVFRELGRGLVSPAVLATSLAARLAATRGRVDLLQGLIAGTLKAAPAVPESSSRRLIAIDAEGADFLLVQVAGATALYPRSAIDVVTAGHAVDEAVSLHHVSIREPFLLRSEEAGLFRRGQILTTSMLVGIGEQARDMAVSHAKERRQFDQPIGAFQAVKHRCADMALRCEKAFAQLLYAAIQERDTAASAAFHGAAAAIVALEAALENTAAAIQIHGGFGFTADCDAHRYLKRARLLEQLGGSMRVQRVRLLAQAFPSSAAWCT